MENGEVTYEAITQDMAIEVIGRDSTVDLSGGKFEKLSLNLSDHTSITADDSTVEEVTINQKNNSNVTLGTVKTLSIIHPEACPVAEKAIVDVQSVNSDNISYNNILIAAETHESQCGSVIFADSDN